jgi:hypothetical protein
LATHAVASVAAVQAAPAIIWSPASSPTNANITHLDVPADADRYDSDERENDDSLMGDGGGGDEDDDKMGIDWEDPHEDLQEAMMWSWLCFAMMCIGEWWVERIFGKGGTFNFCKYHDIFTSYF